MNSVKFFAAIAVGVIAAGALWLLARPEPTTARYEFNSVGQFQVDGNAEVLAATPDGQLLLHTNAMRGSVDIVDIADPENPAALAVVPVSGEPTSVAVTPDGNWALATTRLTAAAETGSRSDPYFPGALVLIDLRTPASATVSAVIGVGHQPDSVAVTRSGPNLYAIMAIENEPIMTGEGDTARDISLPGAVQIVSFDPDRPGSYRVAALDLSRERLKRAGLEAPDDPQPEYVAAAPNQALAAASLQENNGFVLFDPYNLEIKRVFSAGSVNDRLADLTADEQVELVRDYPADALPRQAAAGRRFPDGVAFSPDGTYLLSADEGDPPLTGGRGFSIWTLDGELVWDDAGEIEREAARQGFYPDAQSATRGIEIEGIATARLDGDDYAFVTSESGGFMAIYDISDPAAPSFVQLLTTGSGPESVVSIPGRGLIVTGSEVAGLLHIFRHDPLPGDAGSGR